MKDQERKIVEEIKKWTKEYKVKLNKFYVVNEPDYFQFVSRNELNEYVDRFYDGNFKRFRISGRELIKLINIDSVYEEIRNWNILGDFDIGAVVKCLRKEDYLSLFITDGSMIKEYNDKVVDLLDKELDILNYHKVMGWDQERIVRKRELFADLDKFRRNGIYEFFMVTKRGAKFFESDDLDYDGEVLNVNKIVERMTENDKMKLNPYWKEFYFYGYKELNNLEICLILWNKGLIENA